MIVIIIVFPPQNKSHIIQLHPLSQQSTKGWWLQTRNRLGFPLSPRDSLHNSFWWVSFTLNSGCSVTQTRNINVTTCLIPEWDSRTRQLLLYDQHWASKSIFFKERNYRFCSVQGQSAALISALQDVINKKRSIKLFLFPAMSVLARLPELPVTHRGESQVRMCTTCRGPSLTGVTSVLESPGYSGSLWVCSWIAPSTLLQPPISTMYDCTLKLFYYLGFLLQMLVSKTGGFSSCRWATAVTVWGGSPQWAHPRSNPSLNVSPFMQTLVCRRHVSFNLNTSLFYFYIFFCIFVFSRLIIFNLRRRPLWREWHQQQRPARLQGNRVPIQI